ncbi:protein FAM83A-like [Cyclopterus lumpus]|uniref:protein FAM83A-like n=1 Tax=Cyclopterus lumpus TaxID=8103 RepID=UPI001486B776|nr:protein FAM83A-like [Cyclopterus lumpus]
MDTSGVSVLLYRRSEPRGKARRRVQDVRVPSSSRHDATACRPALDLSHNESARLAVDSLLSRGLEGYRKVLSAEGEVDFLSALEKTYILEHGRDAADPGAADDGDEELESSSAESQSATRCPAVSTDGDPPRADVKRTDAVLGEPNVEVYLQSDSRSASMKDLVREFIRKAGKALAIVMGSFSDVELLCDLLEASRKRNVSVHLLLDHLNLNLFVSMWQNLKLDSKSFPKLSVRSVDGQTYCAKTGRKLTGHITETFIITDWTEALTGSYSFCWLSWQVHRSLVVLVKGSAVVPFHEEFLRLYSSSKPIPSFVTFITVPRTLPRHAAQKANADANESRLSPTRTTCHEVRKQDAQKPDCLDARPLHRGGSGTPTHEEPLEVQPVGEVLTQHGAQRNVEPLVKNQTPIRSHSNPLRLTHVSHVQYRLINATSEKNARAHESTPRHAAQGRHRIGGHQSTFKADLECHNVGTEGLLFWQRNGNRLTEPSGMAAAGPDSRWRQWARSLKVDFRSDYPKERPPSTTQQAKTGPWFPWSHQRGPMSGLQTHMSSQDQPQRRHRPCTLPANPGSFLKPKLKLNSKLFPSGTGATLQPHTRLYWMPQSRTERPRPPARQSFFGATYGTGQTTGLRRCHSGVDPSSGRSMTGRHSAGFKPNTSST